MFRPPQSSHVAGFTNGGPSVEEVQFEAGSRVCVGTTVFYSQAAGVPAGLLDSNVVLDAGDGNRAVGRCTLDLMTNLGLCTFSEGTGTLSSLQARVDVDCTAGCRWDGTYSFAKPDKEK